MQVYEVVRKEIGYDIIIKDNREVWLKLVGDGSAFDEQGNGFIEYNTPVDCKDLDGKWIFHGWIEGDY